MSKLCYCILLPDTSSSGDGDPQTAPLEHVSVTGVIRDAVSQYTLVQTYVNPLKDAAIEAAYTFPLYEGVAVVGFEAEVDGRKIVGKVQEEGAARKEYEEAVKGGKVASLLEQERPDVFQASIGNIPPSKTISIRITLVAEIKQDADENQIRFVLPTSVAPRYGDDPFDGKCSGAAPISKLLSVNMSCTMSKPITSIQSPSHTIQVHLGTSSPENYSTTESASFNPNRARVSLTADSLLDRDLVIIIQSIGLDAPRALIERHPKDGTHAISLSFSPRFALKPVQSSLELIFLVDRSGSMWDKIKLAGEALELFMRSIPSEDHYFNIVGFGSEHEALFPKSVEYNAESLKKSSRYAQTLEADMRGTEMTRAFQELFQRRRRDIPMQIFLLTDGEIWDVDTLVKCIREAVEEAENNNSYMRVFSLGIGSNVSHNLIESVARAGGGYAQLVTEGERMEKKVVNMLKVALLPPVSNVGVRWTKLGFEDNIVEAENESLQDEDFVVVEGGGGDGTSQVADPINESNSNNKPPINLFSTPLEVVSPPPPDLPTPFIHPEIVVPVQQAPFKIPSLYRGARFTIYAILDSSTTLPPKELVLQGSSLDGPVELKVNVEWVQEGETMIHSLAARTLVRDLEEGSSYIHAALGKNTTTTGKQMLKKLGIHVLKEGKRYTNVPLSSNQVSEITKQMILDIALKYNLSSKYTSWVAIDEESHRTIAGSHRTIATALFAPVVGVCCEEVCCEEVRYYSMEVDLDYEEDDQVGVNGVSPPSLAFQGNVMTSSVIESPAFQGNETTSSVIDPHVQLHSILQHQSYDGLFPLIPDIASFFSTTVEALKEKLSELRHQSAMKLLSELEWEAIWATYLTVEFMKEQLPDLQEEWELVVEKAEKKVEALLKNAEDVATIKEAAGRVVRGDLSVNP